MLPAKIFLSNTIMNFLILKKNSKNFIVPFWLIRCLVFKLYHMLRQKQSLMKKDQRTTEKTLCGSEQKEKVFYRPRTLRNFI